MWETEYEAYEAPSFVRIEEEVSKTKLSYLTVFPTQHQQQQRQHQQQPQTDVQSSDIIDRDGRSRQLFETLYNVDMTSGEGMFLSELYLCDPKNKKE